MDSQYKNMPYGVSQRPHRYSADLNLLSDPYLMTQLTRLCHPECVQPEANRLVGHLYRSLSQVTANLHFPRKIVKSPTRMRDQHAEGYYEGEVLDPACKIVIVSLARAGIIPALALFDEYVSILDPTQVRVDHIMINRSTNDAHQVTGASIHGSKIGGRIDDAFVLVPDPMGATGASLSTVMDAYSSMGLGIAKKWISINLIITPEFVQSAAQRHPHLGILSIRLDRGFSTKEALSRQPGELPGEEKGLNELSYIVPGGGGFGELSSNSWV